MENNKFIFSGGVGRRWEKVEGTSRYSHHHRSEHHLEKGCKYFIQKPFLLEVKTLLDEKRRQASSTEREESSISNNNDSDKIMELSGEAKSFTSRVVIVSFLSVFHASMYSWGTGVSSFCFIYPFARWRTKPAERGAGDDEKSTKLCQECAISET